MSADNRQRALASVLQYAEAVRYGMRPTEPLTRDELLAIADALAASETQRIELEQALEEACDWLDNDLAHAPDTPTSMADRELVARWREALARAGAPTGDKNT